MNIEKNLYDMATRFIEKRYPIGWGGVAVMRTSKDNYYTSVAIETANQGASLCIEVGAMAEAHKNKEKVTHAICVVRDCEKSEYKILTPCGICQERLAYWGDDVMVGVTTEDRSIKFVPLNVLQPYHWSKAYPSENIERWKSDNM